MKNYLYIVLIILATYSCQNNKSQLSSDNGNSLANDSAQYDAILKDLIKIGGGFSLFEQGTQTFNNYVYFAMQTVSDLNSLQAELLTTRYMKERMLDIITQISAPRYRKYMSLSNLQEALDYYRSPKGKRCALGLQKVTSPETQSILTDWIDLATKKISIGESVDYVQCEQPIAFMKAFDRVYRLSNTDSTLNNILKSIEPVIIANELNGRAIYEELSTQLKRNAGALYAKIYASAFTVEDINNLATFLESQVGQMINMANLECAKMALEDGITISNDFRYWIIQEDYNRRQSEVKQE